MDSDDFKAQQQTIQAALVAVNRTVNGIAAEDLTFLRTVNPDVAGELDDQAARLLRLSNGLLRAAAGATGRRAPPTLEDTDDVELHWRGVVDVIDALLEKADTSLDEYTGLLKRKDAPTQEGAKPTSDRLDWSLRRANIDKPQELFEHKPDNFDAGPWKPLLTTKPHATYVSLADSLTTFVDDNGHTQYRHPYETEITRLNYPAAVYQTREPIPYQPVEGTEATWVDTWEGVEAMLAELRGADEIAVDLEHHDFRTYTGLLSLMQISTRDKDWIVDTLQPWRHRLEALNEVLADPTKLKVFHGASSDIVWLQRDLGLYVVGLFDTYFACDCLEYSKRSLAFLLDKFVGFAADKKYQMADWRIRPLSDEMLYYARSDTHYLLYIYDMVRNELAARSDGTDPDKDLTSYVLRKSKEVSLQRHETQTYDADTGAGPRGWLNSLLKTATMMNAEQFAVYRALFQWRDNLCRRLDESTGFILPNRVLADIARIVPPDQKALLNLLGGGAARVTKAHLGELFDVVQTAKARGAAGGPTSNEFLRSEPIRRLTAARFANSHGYGGGSGGSSVVSAAATARQLAGAGGTAAVPATAPVPDVTELRSTFSQLWGATLSGRSAKCDRADTATDDNGGALIDAPWYVQAALLGPTAATAAAATKDPDGRAPLTAANRPPPTEEYIALPPLAQKPAIADQTTDTPMDEVEAKEDAEAEAESAEAEEAEKAEEAEEADGEVEERDKATAKEDDDDVFTLKWGKKGRPTPTGADAAASGKAKDKKPGKKESKKERKAAKAAKKTAKRSKGAVAEAAATASEATSASGTGSGAATTSDSDGGGAPIHSGGDEDEDKDEDFVPFDYDTAGSVLHARNAAPGAGTRPGGKAKKIFNPYGSKGDDGPKAARRMHYEKTGKTGTFRK